MKLLIVTAVRSYEKDILRLFKEAQIESFSTSDIGGFKTATTMMQTSWFSGENSAVESIMYFSFTDDEHVDELFALLKTFNANLETNNPARAVVIDIARQL